MKKKWRWILLSIMLCLFFNTAKIYASESSVSLEIPVSVTLKGNIPANSDEFQFVLVPANDQMPMPENDLMKIQGENKVSFDGILFTKPGIYTYTIRQIPGKSDCVYDDSEYHIKVYVTNNDNQLALTTIIYKENENDKIIDANFVNEYPVKETNGLNNVSTGDSTNLRMNYMILILSLGIMIYIVWINRKKEDDVY